MKQQLRTTFVSTALALAFPIASMADITDQALTIPIGSSVNLETGAVVPTGGDLKWDGLSLNPQNGAKATYIGPGDSIYQGLNQQSLQASAALLVSTTAIPVGGLTGGSVLAVLTTAGHWAKLEVTTTTAPASSPLPIKFTTYGSAGGGSGGPSITDVLNNSSNIPAGFPNSGIAQGSLFKILGTGLADSGDAALHDSQAAGGLPTTLNGASVTVTAGATIIHPALYYSTPTQIDGVLPSSAPVGSATVTVTKGTASNAFQIQIVAAAPGITTYSGSTGVAQRASSGALITYTASAVPGDVLIVWGTGVGATGNSDTAYDTSGHQTSVPYAFYIGGVSASVAYKGASVYPGVDVFGVTVPSNVPTGCYIPLAAVATVNGNSIVSNVATLPISAAGSACSDPQLGYNGNQISTLNGQSSVKNGFLIVSQATIPGTGVTNSASAIFSQTSGVSSAGGGTVSIGGCILSQSLTGSTGTSTGLNAGTITVTGPGGAPVTLTALPQVAGFYFGTLSSIPSTGGAYVFNATAGSQVGAFQTTVNFPNPLLVWTSSAANVTRSQGLNVTWTGGAPGSYVLISGSSTSGTTVGGYTCIAPQSAGQFTVPPYILLGLPAGTGTTTVQNSTNFTTFSATGLDFGGALGSVSFSSNSTYN